MGPDLNYQIQGTVSPNVTLVRQLFANDSASVFSSDCASDSKLLMASLET